MIYQIYFLTIVKSFYLSQNPALLRSSKKSTLYNLTADQDVSEYSNKVKYKASFYETPKQAEGNDRKLKYTITESQELFRKVRSGSNKKYLESKSDRYDDLLKSIALNGSKSSSLNPRKDSYLAEILSTDNVASALKCIKELHIHSSISKVIYFYFTQSNYSQ